MPAVCSPRLLGVGDRKVSKAQELETSLGQRSMISSPGAKETAQRLIKSIFLCKLQDWDLDPSMHIHADVIPSTPVTPALIGVEIEGLLGLACCQPGCKATSSRFSKRPSEVESN